MTSASVDSRASDRPLPETASTENNNVSENESPILASITQFLQTGTSPHVQEWLSSIDINSEGEFVYSFDVEGQGGTADWSEYATFGSKILSGASLKLTGVPYLHSKFTDLFSADTRRVQKVVEEVAPIETSFESLSTHLASSNVETVVSWAETEEGQKVVAGLLSLIAFKISNESLDEKTIESYESATKTLIKIGKGEKPSEEELAQLQPVVQGLKTALIPANVNAQAQKQLLTGVESNRQFIDTELGRLL